MARPVSGARNAALCRLRIRKVHPASKRFALTAVLGAEVAVDHGGEGVAQNVVIEVLRRVFVPVFVFQKAAFEGSARGGFHLFTGVPTFSIIEKRLPCTVGDIKGVASTCWYIRMAFGDSILLQQHHDVRPTWSIHFDFRTTISLARIRATKAIGPRLGSASQAVFGIFVPNLLLPAALFF